MRRRTLLGRLTAATAGVAATGIASASVERRPAEIDGKTYLVRTDVDPDRVSDIEDLNPCCPGCQPKCFACCQDPVEE